MNEQTVMLLIDADNVSADVIEQAVSWVAKHYGGPHVRRAYCTAEAAVKHQGLFKRLSIRPMVNLAAGKNSTDIALAVDAIDLALAERPGTIVVASSDSDFAPLVSRLREKGCRVVGLGQHGKTGEETKGVYDDYEVFEHRRAAVAGTAARSGVRGTSPERAQKAPARGAKSSSRRGGRGEAPPASPRPPARASGRPVPAPDDSLPAVRAEAPPPMPMPEVPAATPAPETPPAPPAPAPEALPTTLAEPAPVEPASLPELPEATEEAAPAAAPAKKRASRKTASRAAKKAPSRSTEAATGVEPELAPPATPPEAAEPAAKAPARKSAAAKKAAKKTTARKKAAAAVEVAPAAEPAPPAVPPAVAPEPAPPPVPAPPPPPAPVRPPPPAPTARAAAEPADRRSAPTLEALFACLPELAAGQQMELNVAAQRLREAQLLSRSGSSLKLFRQFGDRFELLPPGNPHKVRRAGGR